MEIKHTDDIKCKYAHILIYGESGVGKTRLISTAPKPIVLSAEGGLLSLKRYNIPYIEIKSDDDLKQAYKYLSVKNDDYETVVLDSLTEIGEVIFQSEKKKLLDDAKRKGAKVDQRMAYVTMKERIEGLVRVFKMLPYHIYMIAHSELSETDGGDRLFYPALPGSKAKQKMPHFYDEVFAMKCVDGTDSDGKKVKSRYLITANTGNYIAKDRSEELNIIEEEPNLTDLINRMLSTSSKENL